MRSYIAPEFQEEERKLLKIILNSKEELTIEEFIEKYGSEDYKRYLSEREKKTMLCGNRELLLIK